MREQEEKKEIRERHSDQETDRKIDVCVWGGVGVAIKRLRTRSAAVRHWRDFGLKRLRTRSCHE